MTTRRASVLLAVLIVVAIGAMIGTSILLRSQAHRSTAAVSVRRTQTAALAWSGVNAAMAELAAQRETLLDGGEPSLTTEWELYREGAWRAVVRLVPVGDRLVQGENARLDVNHATKEMLAKLPGVDEALAEKILATRGKELTSLEPLRALTDKSPGEVEVAGGSSNAGASVGWLDCLTVYGFEPNIQIGVKGNEAGRGLKRIVLSSGWTQGARDAVAERFGEDLGRLADDIFKDAPPFKKDSELIALFRRVGSKPENWIEAMDFFATTPDDYRVARVDLNRSSAEVLACIPGIDKAAADRIVAARQSLTEESRRNVVWPAIEGILNDDQFEQAVDWLCVRTTQWRVRVEAGFLPIDEEAGSGDGRGLDPIAFQGEPEPPVSKSGMRHAMQLEAVIDVAGRRPRLAYLRDVTYLQEANELRTQILASSEPTSVVPDPEPVAASPAPAPPRRDTLKTRSEQPPPPEEEPGGNERPGTGGEEPASVDRRLGRWTPGRKG